MTMFWLVVVLVAAAIGWGLVTVLRLRRRHYLIANRPRVIEESLERARSKQREYRRRTGKE